MFSSFRNWLLNSTEPFVELIIRLCGWSAILFVFGIFLFILIEGAPFLANKLEYEVQEARLEGASGRRSLVFGVPHREHERTLRRLLSKCIEDGRVEGVQAVWFNFASEPAPRVLIDLESEADPGRVESEIVEELDALVQQLAEGMEDETKLRDWMRSIEADENVDPAELVLERIPAAAAVDPGSGESVILKTPYLHREESARRLAKCSGEGEVRGVTGIWYRGVGASHHVLIELEPGVPLEHVAGELFPCVPSRALVLTELPHEDPEASVLKRVSRATAAGRIPGVREIRLETEPEVVVVVDLEEGANSDVVVTRFLESVPLRKDLSQMGEFFTSELWIPDSKVRRRFGILALIAGTLSVTLLAMVIAVPFGLGSAIFVSEFCGGKLRETLKIVIELLAAIPSVVWGFIAYMVLSPILIQVTGRQPGINMLNGSVVLALMSVPVIVSVGEDALKAVPDSFREAAVALGASRWQIIYKVLVPAAKNGLLAAVLLGVGRAIGETMAVLMATGHAVKIPESIFDPVRTLTATIAAELGEAVKHGGHYRALFLIGMVLMIFAFVINFTADVVVKGIRGKQNA